MRGHGSQWFCDKNLFIFRFLLLSVEFSLYLVVLDFGHSLSGRLLLFLDCFWDWRFSKFYQHWRRKFHCSVKRYVFFNFTLFGTGRALCVEMLHRSICDVLWLPNGSLGLFVLTLRVLRKSQKHFFFLETPLP